MIAGPWVVKQVRRPAFPGQRPNTTTANLVRNWENTRSARAAPYANMRNVRVCGMPPAVQRIARIIVTSAADKGLLFIPSPLRGEG